MDGVVTRAHKMRCTHFGEIWTKYWQPICTQTKLDVSNNLSQPTRRNTRSTHYILRES